MLNFAGRPGLSTWRLNYFGMAIALVVGARCARNIPLRAWVSLYPWRLHEGRFHSGLHAFDVLAYWRAGSHGSISVGWFGSRACFIQRRPNLRFRRSLDKSLWGGCKGCDFIGCMLKIPDYRFGSAWPGPSSKSDPGSWGSGHPGPGNLGFP